MADHAYTPTPSTPVTRRALALGAGAFAAAGIAAGVAASAADLVEAPGPDAELLALWPRFNAILAEVSETERLDELPSGKPDTDHNAWLNRVGEEYDDVCWEVIDAPAAQTPEGRAFKAAAAMHQLRFSYGCGGWGGSGEEMAWLFLSELAGDAYVSVQLPERLAHEEPGRA